MHEQASELWARYVALMNIERENELLKADLSRAERALAAHEEGLRELGRLRSLMEIPDLESWQKVGARVVSGRFGPHAALETIILNKGFSGGAEAGAPVVSRQGLVGRVYRASPNYSTVLLLTDANFRVSVISQESRIRGIFAGSGVDSMPEVHYIAQNAQLKPGELLISSGLDGYVPKGIPVARVSSIQPGHETLFQQVLAVPVVNLDNLEEVVLLLPEASSAINNLSDFTGLPVPEKPAEENADGQKPARGQNARSGPERRARQPRAARPSPATPELAPN